MSERTDILPSGTMLRGGQYRIDRHLASGGFGNTYLAMDVNLNAKVAIKEFYIKTINYRESDSRTVGVSNASNLDMFHSLRNKFKKEAQRIFKIQHGNVVRVFSLFEEFGTVYYAMDFIEGESLNSIIKRDGPVGEPQARSVFLQMLDALEVVHQSGFFHLDIKPHNIMLTPDGVVKLIDFGASKHANKAEATTITGFAFTPEYAPPELTNQEYDEIGPWTDIYSLGITLYRILSDAPIPSKKDIRVKGASAFVYSQPVSDAMQQLIVNMTQGASERRPQSIAQLRALANQLGLIGGVSGSRAQDIDQPYDITQNFGMNGILTLPTTNEKTVAVGINGNREFVVNGVKFTMVPVEGGTFNMGATPEQGSDAADNEKPVHKATLSSYYIGQTEVTQELWQAVMGNNPSYNEGDKLPVVNVSWNDCQEFIRKLNALTGQQFRVPTEAEWEYAARGGNKSQGYKYSGSNNIKEVAWYGCKFFTFKDEHDVATKSPNELGIYDMSGNVFEWCQDWYGSYSSDAQANPKGPTSACFRVDLDVAADCRVRVCRGGSWAENAGCCRVAYRSCDYVDSRSIFIGLRLAQ